MLATACVLCYCPLPSPPSPDSTGLCAQTRQHTPRRQRQHHTCRGGCRVGSGRCRHHHDCSTARSIALCRQPCPEPAGLATDASHLELQGRQAGRQAGRLAPPSQPASPGPASASLHQSPSAPVVGGPANGSPCSGGRRIRNLGAVVIELLGGHIHLQGVHMRQRGIPSQAACMALLWSSALSTIPLRTREGRRCEACAAVHVQGAMARACQLLVAVQDQMGGWKWWAASSKQHGTLAT